MEEAHCELCSEKFHMIVKKKRVFSPDVLRRSGWQNLIFSMFLLVLLYILIMLIIYFINSLINGNNFTDSTQSIQNTELLVLKWFVIIICAVCAVILIVSIVFIWRDACCTEVSTQWIILDANQDMPPSIEMHSENRDSTIQYKKDLEKNFSITDNS